MVRIERRSIAMIVVLALLISFGWAQEQPQGPETLATGLTEPRMIHYDDNGNLFVAEAGYGGAVSTQWGEPNAYTVPARLGGTSQVRLIAPDGQSSVLLGGMYSMNGAPPPGIAAYSRNVYGVTVALPHEDSLWIAFGAGPVGTPAHPLSSTVLELDRETLRIRNVIDLARFEMEHDPDGQGIGSNPTDVAIGRDGTVYIVDAGCNCLVAWTQEDGLGLVHAWAESPDAVPDAIDVGPNGDIYVGFLTGVPFPQEGSRIERWTPSGELVQTYPGLTTVVDVLVLDDGTIYAVEFTSGFDPVEGLPPYSGRVVEVTADGPVSIADRLNYPYGLAHTPDGTLAVTVDSAFVGEGFGSVIAIERP